MAKKIDDTELNGAAPVEAPDNVKNLVAEIATPKPARKAKLKAQTALASEEDVKPDYAALGVEETEVETYEKLRLRFKEFGRRSTAQVFECGEVVAELQELTPDQETFAKRAKGVLNLSRRGAENYANVYRHLQPYRVRLVRLAMIASALYDLATAEPEQIEAVLAAREAGQALTGAQIKEMLGKASGPSVSPDDGGPAGLRARIAEKTSVGVAALMDNAAALLEALLVALEPHRQGKRIVVKETQRSFIHPARMVREQLEWLTWVAVPAPASFAEGAIHHVPVMRGIPSRSSTPRSTSWATSTAGPRRLRWARGSPTWWRRSFAGCSVSVRRRRTRWSTRWPRRLRPNGSRPSRRRRVRRPRRRRLARRPSWTWRRPRSAPLVRRPALMLPIRHRLRRRRPSASRMSGQQCPDILPTDHSTTILMLAFLAAHRWIMAVRKNHHGERADGTTER